MIFFKEKNASTVYFAKEDPCFETLGNLKHSERILKPERSNFDYQIHYSDLAKNLRLLKKELDLINDFCQHLNKLDEDTYSRFWNTSFNINGFEELNSLLEVRDLLGLKE